MAHQGFTPLFSQKFHVIEYGVADYQRMSWHHLKTRIMGFNPATTFEDLKA